MRDIILEKFFESERWSEALNKGSIKGIKKVVLKELMSPVGRKQMLLEILNGEYSIEPPRTAKIPKDTPGEFRTVFINTDKDRVFLSLVNDLLFELTSDMIHPACTSYQKGIGCSQIVTKASSLIEKLSGDTHKVIGWKSDLSKYFDSVPLRYIDEALDEVEKRYRRSIIIDIVREYYHNNEFYDSEQGQTVTHYQSLKQGCAVASWLANVVLYHIDEKLSKLDGFYVRYSDDMLYIGNNYEEAMKIVESELEKMDMKLNPKKVEYLTNDKWFKFLGYSIKGKHISLSQQRIKKFRNEIYKRTAARIRDGVKYPSALRSVLLWLYYGDGKHSWATSVLKTINMQKDIDTLNSFVMDCLRAVQFGKSCSKKDLGGLGWVREREGGCIDRGKGRRVRTLRNNTSEILDGYLSLRCMRNNLMYGRELYDAVVRGMF